MATRFVLASTGVLAGLVFWMAGPAPASAASMQVTASDDVYLPDNAFADAPGMSITLDPVGTDVLAGFSVTLYNESPTPQIAVIAIQVDGTERVRRLSTLPVGQWSSVSVHWLELGMSSGSHTIKVAWYAPISSQIHALGLGGVQPRVLSVVDIPAGTVGGLAGVPDLREAPAQTSESGTNVGLLAGVAVGAAAGAVVLGEAFRVVRRRLVRSRLR